jgi:hypothetical protein
VRFGLPAPVVHCGCSSRGSFCLWGLCGSDYQLQLFIASGSSRNRVYPAVEPCGLPAPVAHYALLLSRLFLPLGWCAASYQVQLFIAGSFGLMVPPPTCVVFYAYLTSVIPSQMLHWQSVGPQGRRDSGLRRLSPIDTLAAVATGRRMPRRVQATARQGNTLVTYVRIGEDVDVLGRNRLGRGSHPVMNYRGNVGLDSRSIGP